MGTGLFSVCGTKEIEQAQLSTTKHIIESASTIVRDDCGFGKTAVILHSAAWVAEHHQGVTLVVSDSEPAKGTWVTEHLEWQHLKHLDVMCLAGLTPAKRLKTIKSRTPDVVVVNYSILKWLVTHNRFKYLLVAADEANCLKGSKSKWRNQLLKLSEHAKSRVAATATPMSSDAMDYWGVLRWCDNGALLGENVTSFRDMYCRQNHFKQWEIRNKKTEKLVLEKIQHLFIEHKMVARADIPIETIYVESHLSKDSQRTYDRFKEIGAEALNLQSQEKNDKPLGKMQISNKLSCLTSGFIYEEVVEAISHYDLMHSSDIDALLNDTTNREAIPIFEDRKELFMKTLAEVEARHGKGRIVIVYWFKHELAQLQEMLPTGVSDKDCSDLQWNVGWHDYMFAQYLRSAKGRNWQKDGNVMIAYSQAFHFVQMYQMPRRIARQGQKEEKVYFYILHFLNTLDDDKRKAIGKRQKAHDNMSSIVIEQTAKRGL